MIMFVYQRISSGEITIFETSNIDFAKQNLSDERSTVYPVSPGPYMIGENTALSKKPPTNQTTIRLIGGMAGWLIRSMYIIKILSFQFITQNMVQ